VISNRYGFIFIHTPKTGGTSISTALHADTNEECEVHYSDQGDITHIYPSAVDFPWWKDWQECQLAIDRLYRDSIDKHNNKYNTNISINIHHGHAGDVFSQYSYGGNIKHLPIYHWVQLQREPRIRGYNSFYKDYFYIGSCRNPYHREFSSFLYHSGEQLHKESATLTSSEISALIQEKWKSWTDEWKKECKEIEEGDFEGTPGGIGWHNYIVKESQASYLALPGGMGVPAPLYLTHDGANTVPGVHALIRTEHIEEDYDTVCKTVGISRKASRVPHVLSTRHQWRKYLPTDILEWYTDTMLDSIHKFRAFDFTCLGYKKVK